MKKGILVIGLVLCSVFVFGQWDITRRTVYCDSLNARVTKIYINSDVVIKDTTLQDYIAAYSAATAAAAGSTGDIQLNNGGVLGVGNDFSFNDTTLSIEYGTGNLFIGKGVAANFGTNKYNTIIGVDAGGLSTGTSNTFLGERAGLNNITGSRNIFLGASAGRDETGSDKLYIDPTNSAAPLIYGEFDNDSVVINGSARITGSLDVGGVVSSGMLRQTSTWHLFGGFQDSTVLIDLTQDVYSHVSNATGDLWTGVEAEGFTASGDTTEVLNDGDYVGSYAVTFTGSSGIVYKFRVWNVTQAKQEGFAVAATGDGTGDFVTVTKPLYFDGLTAGDKLVLQVTNIDNSTDITIKFGSYIIQYIHD